MKGRRLANGMDLKILQDTPPWDWPRDAGKEFQQVLLDRGADASDRLIAAGLAGDLTVINDELAGCLTAIVRSPDEPESLRADAATSALLPQLLYVDDQTSLARRMKRCEPIISRV